MAVLDIVLAGVSYNQLKKGENLNEQATRKNIKSFTKIAEAEEAQRHTKETMTKAVIKLTNRKKAVLSTTMDSFLNLYGRIKKINFTESDGIRELDNFSPNMLEEIHNQVVFVGKISNPPAITKNVVFGYLTGGIVGALAASITDDAKRNLDAARIHARQAEAVIMAQKTISHSYQAISERVNRMTDILTKLNFLFRKSIQHTNEIIDRNGFDKKQYSAEERKDLGNCMNLAGVVKNILDVPIIDENNELTEKSMIAILMGEQCLAEISQVI